MRWHHAPRCPGCGWLFNRPADQTRVFCLACESDINLPPPQPAEHRADG